MLSAAHIAETLNVEIAEVRKTASEMLIFSTCGKYAPHQAARIARHLGK